MGAWSGMTGRRTRQQQKRETDVIRLRYSKRTGLPPTKAFYDRCVEAKRSTSKWFGQGWRLRCTGVQDWDRPMGGVSLGELPMLETAIDVAAALVPGGAQAKMALEMMGAFEGLPSRRAPTPAPARSNMQLIGYYGPYPVVILLGG